MGLSTREFGRWAVVRWTGNMEGTTAFSLRGVDEEHGSSRQRYR
jgi:hypothetical protein